MLPTDSARWKASHVPLARDQGRRQITRTFTHQLRQSWCRQKTPAPESTTQSPIYRTAALRTTAPRRIIVPKSFSQTFLDKRQLCMHQNSVNSFTLTHPSIKVHHPMTHDIPTMREVRQFSIISMTAGFLDHPNSQSIFSLKTMRFLPYNNALDRLRCRCFSPTLFLTCCGSYFWLTVPNGCHLIK